MTESQPKHETTWDGLPVSRQKPYGASVVVFRVNGNDIELLMLHRGHLGTDFEGPWAWTPPSGARIPGESIQECARRELLEEAGLELQLQETDVSNDDWAVYVAEARSSAVVRLDAEHDRFEWMSADSAIECCQPDVPHALLASSVKWIQRDVKSDNAVWSLEAALRQLASSGTPATEVFKHGTLSVEIFHPKGTDTQQPHTRDEVYIVARGRGVFFRSGTRVDAVPGTFLFVAAGEEHRFESFSDDFIAWVFFYGPEGGER